MKKKYKICIIIWLAEFITVYFCDKANVHISSLFINAIATLLFFLPVVILFVLMSKDEGFSTKSRMFFKFIYVFIILCYAGGLAINLLLKTD